MGQPYLFKFSLLISLHLTLAVFFHEKSYVVLKTDLADQETFGFSLAHQNGSQENLVTGAPHNGLTGKVFKCPLNEVLKTPQSCKEAVIDVDKLAPYNRAYAPNVKLNLGYSVSATPDYFFTCAPLWTTSLATPNDDFTDKVVGTCFVYNDTAYRYSGFVETSGDTIVSTNKKVVGGSGWRTMVDEENEMLLIAKVGGEQPEVTHVNSLDPLQQVASLLYTGKDKRSKTLNENFFKNYRLVGFSLAAGKFFDTKTTAYAISSINTNTNRGVIHFLFTEGAQSLGGEKTLPRSGSRYNVFINSINKQGSEPEMYEVGSMFGASMCSANLNLDLLSELVVGAPAQENVDEGIFEAGAVHIYLGGSVNHIDDPSRHRLILGNKERSRFGTAVASADIDGDYLSEIFVSAPYEGLHGEGALYILSGSEIYTKLMTTGSFAKISISHLALTQRIVSSSGFKTFGYSLQVVPDVDGNGCDELAVGSPGSQNIMLLRCLPSLNVTVEASHIGNQTTVHDTSFTVEVCVSVEDMKNRSLSLRLTVTNEVIGSGAYIENHQRSYSMNLIGMLTKERKCENVVVQLGDNELGTYFVYSNVRLDEAQILNSKDFDQSWAMLSPYSRLNATEKVSRRCKGSDCEPYLTMDMTWTGGKFNNLAYILGSSDLLTASLKVTNKGNSSWESCALVRVTGASVALLACSEDKGQYKCLMPTPLRRNAEYSIDIRLNMTKPTNKDEVIEVNVILQDFCGRPKNSTDETYRLMLSFEPKEVMVTGSTQDQQISDIELQDSSVATVSDAQQYWIENNGNVEWIEIVAEVTIYVQPYIKSYRVSSVSSECTKEDGTDKMIFLCIFTLPPRSKVKVIASTDIIKDKIMENLNDNQLTVQSSLVLSNLYPSYKEQKQHSLSTIITFQREQSFAQNKNLIVFLAVLGAMIILVIITYILWKMEFFKSKEKTKLEELKQEHALRQSMKTTPSSGEEALEDLDIEVEDGDDSPFEVVDMETPVLPPDQGQSNK